MRFYFSLTDAVANEDEATLSSLVISAQGPSIPALHLRVANQSEKIMRVEYRLYMTYNDHDRCDSTQVAGVSLYKPDGALIPWPANFVRGSRLSGQARAYLANGVTEWAGIEELAVRGQNPSYELLKAYLQHNPAALVVAFIKSGLKMFDGQGLPLYNTSNEKGFGLFQISKFDDEEPDGLWNWKLNCYRGLENFLTMQTYAVDYEQKTMAENKGLPNFTDEQRLLEAFQQYGEDHYFMPEGIKGEPGSWRWRRATTADKPSLNTCFADCAGRILKQYEAGLPPSRWEVCNC